MSRAFNEYVVGALVRVSAVFQNAAGVAADPSGVTFSVRAPNGATTTYTYGTDVELVKDSTGNYHVDVSAVSAGTWTYRFAGTGSGQSSTEYSFIVRASQVAA